MAQIKSWDYSRKCFVIYKLYLIFIDGVILPEHLVSPSVFQWYSCCSISSFLYSVLCVLCVFLSFLFWPFDLQVLITPLVSATSSSEYQKPSTNSLFEYKNCTSLILRLILLYFFYIYYAFTILIIKKMYKLEKFEVPFY